MYKNTTGEPVNLEAVGYTTYTSADQEYDVSVYTGLTKSSDPTSGKLEGTTRVSTSTIGCKTAVLDEPVYIAPGETYSIVFDFTDFTDFGTEVPFNGAEYTFEAQIDPGQSFFSKVKRSKVSGIEIQYSTSKSFSRNVRTTYAASGSKSKKLKGLKSKKRYYVRTRTYKNAGGVRQVSRWSKVRSAKVK